MSQFSFVRRVSLSAAVLSSLSAGVAVAQRNASRGAVGAAAPKAAA